jgi:outer membrane murein-binding lipoprotein Lpp
LPNSTSGFCSRVRLPGSGKAINKRFEMPLARKLTASIPVAALLIIGGLSISGCATKEYVNDRIAEVNTRITAVDAKATDAQQQAAAANAAAQNANAAAQKAEADAQNDQTQINQLSTRVDALSVRPAKSPRG